MLVASCYDFNFGVNYFAVSLSYIITMSSAVMWHSYHYLDCSMLNAERLLFDRLRRWLGLCLPSIRNLSIICRCFSDFSCFLLLVKYSNQCVGGVHDRFFLLVELYGDPIPEKLGFSHHNYWPEKLLSTVPSK